MALESGDWAIKCLFEPQKNYTGFLGKGNTLHRAGKRMG